MIDEVEYVTEGRCDKRRGGTRWTLMFIGGFVLAMVAGAGTAISTAGKANSKAERNEARIDSMESHIKDRLDDIWNHIRDSP